MRANRATAFVLMVVAVLGGRVSAHRLDELLQSARIAVERHRVEIELDLTPGAGMVETIIADIDRDADGTTSADEERAYAERVLGAIELAVDGHPLELQATAWTFPDREAFRRGEGTIRIHSATAFAGLSGGVHRLSFQNGYRREASVYLANALVPTDDGIAVTAQHRDAAQRQVTIDYVLGPASTAISIWLASITSMVFITALSLRRRVEKPGRGKQ